MKYFSPSYWFKLWVLSAPLFNDKTQGINVKSIDNNQKIKDWTSNNTNLQSINQDMTFINSSTNYQPYNLIQTTNQTIDPIYKTKLKASNYEHQHEKIKYRHKRQQNVQQLYLIKSNHYNEYLYAATNRFAYDSDRRRVFTWRGDGWELYDSLWKFENKNGLSNIIKDFPDYDKQEINLGLINDNNDNDIKNAIKQKYPNLEINGIKIAYKSDYLDFIPGYSTKISISKINEICFYDYYSKLTQNFIYTTKTKLNEISNIIANDPKVKQWIAHINDWNSSLPTKIEQLKTYTDSQKWSAKNTEKEIIKSYIRDWSYVSTLIEHELKLDNLNKNVQGVKTYFENIKNLVNNLDEKITKLDSAVTNVENPTNWNCANIATVISGTLGGTALATSATIPVIGTVGAGVLTITAGACAIAGV